MRNKVEDCKYNVGVGCGEKLGCEKCGWNPEVIEKRKTGRKLWQLAERPAEGSGRRTV